MNFFKRLFTGRPATRSNEHEIYRREARQFEQAGDIARAAYFYEEAEDCEKAADLYLAMREKSPTHLPSPEGIADLYFKASSFTKMTEVLARTLDLHDGALQHLHECGQLDPFISRVLEMHTDSDLDLEVNAFQRKGDRLYWLFRKLLQIDEPAQAGRLFLHFRKTMGPFWLDILRALVAARLFEPAPAVYESLADRDALNDAKYRMIAEVFIEAERNDVAQRVYEAYFSKYPERAAEDARQKLKIVGMWQAFAIHATKTNPLMFGQVLWHELFHAERGAFGGEMEAELLVECYDLVGHRALPGPWPVEGTLRWLLMVSDFWLSTGETAKADSVRTRYAEERARAGII